MLELPTCLSLPFCVIMSTQDVRVEALLNIRCIVKGYYLCRFEANVGEVFTANKKRREGGNAFKVVNHRELVDPLWPLRADVSELVNYFFYILNCNKQSRRTYMKLLKTHTLLCTFTACKIVFFVFTLVPSICNQLIPINVSINIDHHTNR